MGASFILLRIPSNELENPIQRHKKLMRYLNNERKANLKENGHDGDTGDWQTIIAVDDQRLRFEETFSPQDAEAHARVMLEKWESVAFLVIDPKMGLEIHLWGLAAE